MTIIDFIKINGWWKFNCAQALGNSRLFCHFFLDCLILYHEYCHNKFLPLFVPKNFRDEWECIPKWPAYINYHKFSPTKLPFCLQGGSLPSNHWSCKPNAGWIKESSQAQWKYLAFLFSSNFQFFNIYKAMSWVY